MFTLNIRKANGEEHLSEAEVVSKEPGGILVQHAARTAFYGPGGHEYALDSLVRSDPVGGVPTDCSIPSHALAYVMNRFGSTVATYHL